MTRTLQDYQAAAQSQGGRALLDMIAHAEGADYRTMFGGSRFDTSQGWRHPDKAITGGGYTSTAAGRYQFLTPTWNEVAGQLGIKDFSPANQDAAAMRLVERRGVNLDDVAAGKVDANTLAKLAPEWASLPTMEGKSFYGQPVKKASDLLARFTTAAKGAPPQPGAGFQGASAPAAARTAPGGVSLVNPYESAAGRAPVFTAVPGGQNATDVALAAIGAAVAAGAPGGEANAGLQYLAARGAQGRQANQRMAGQLMEMATGQAPAQAAVPARPQPQAAAPAQQPQMMAGGGGGGGSLRVGRVADPKEDVFPTTGAHLDVRVQNPDGSYINPKTARSLLANLHVGGKPLYTQRGSDWVESHPVTSGFGPRRAPVAGASTNHMGVDYGVAANVPLEWRGGGTYSFEGGVGRIALPDGRRVKLLHTRPK